uniref:Penicillin amidase n=1 Tax=mine drainage metagenome TaxID=410659 RepID=E6QIN5_9ZZZZ
MRELRQEQILSKGVFFLKRFRSRAVVLCAGALVVLALSVGVAGVVWIHRAMVASLPVVDGELSLAGLSAPVVVRRDAHGVPHIQAANQDDLMLAQGYVTAQERMWQMDMLRRNAAGELAEILGRVALEHDRMQRVLQFHNVADRVYRSLPADEQHRYQQYARGVNLYLAENAHRLPVEFRLMHYRPKPWRGEDTVLIGMNMVQMLDTHWDVKLAREKIAEDLKDPKLEGDLYPVGSWRDQPPTTAVADMTEPHPSPDAPDEDLNQSRNGSMRSGDETAASDLPTGDLPSAEELRGLRRAMGLAECAGCSPGSNNWVVSGKHTASGKPLLSNDMHLDLTVPNIWFMAELDAPGLHVAGVTLPGMPLVVAGHNEHIAWGFTALYADVQDLYVERLDGRGNYWAADGPEVSHGSWQPLAHAREVIHVRFGRDVPVDVELTAHGPLLSPITRTHKRAIALRWTLYDPALATIPMYAINTAANWQQFSSALEAWCWPTQNVVYADDAGHIGYQAVGKVPLRPGGLMGVPITDTRHEWQGYIPFDQMPHAYDPPSGLLATANSRVTANDTQYPLTLEWVDPYRAERIYQDLRGRNGLKREDMLAVQTDIYSAVDQELAHRFAYAIDRTEHVDSRLKQAADLMRSWDGRLTKDSAAASVVDRAREALWPLILKPKLGKDAALYQWSESNFAEEQIIMNGESANGAPSAWLPHGYRNWDALLTDAVRQGMDQGRATGDVSAWRYGRWHVVDLEHPLLKMIPMVKGWTGTGPAAAERGHDDGETSGARVWAKPAVHDGLERAG